MSDKQRLVVVGNGMAPGRMLDHLLDDAPDLFDITIFNAEPRVNYNRLMLSPVLSGEKSYQDIITHDDDWYAQNSVTLIKGEKIVEIDRGKKTVRSHLGTVAPYDSLVLATGSNPLIIPLPGHELEGVMTYRDLDDVERMISASKDGGRAVVIGGGLLGLEAAAGLKIQGMDVTVLHLMPTLMERQLDPAAGALLKAAFEDRAIDVITKANSREIKGKDGKVCGIELDDGSFIDADIIVMAVGIRPSVELARRAGLEVNRGIHVGDDMRTCDRDIFALGECVEHKGICYGLVSPLYDMAKVLAEQLKGNQSARYEGSSPSTKLKVTGIDLFSAGDFAFGEDREDIILRDVSAGIYKRLILKENRLIGAVLYGDTEDGPWFADLIRLQADLSDRRETLIFGRAFDGVHPPDPMGAVAVLPDDAGNCGCNGDNEKISGTNTSLRAA